MHIYAYIVNIHCGGGLIAGIAAYVKRLRPEIKIIGVEPKGACALWESLKVLVIRVNHTVCMHACVRRLCCMQT